MKNRILTFLLVMCLLTQCCAIVLAENSLADPVDVSASVASQKIVLQRADGTELTLPDGSGKTKLLVFGRTTCGYTLAFMNGIRNTLSKLNQAGVKVVTGLIDSGITPDIITEFENSYSGIIAGEHISGMWENLYAMGWPGGSVTLPVIFILDGSGKLRYCSTGPMSEPLRVAGGAIAVAEGTAPEEPEQPQTPDEQQPEQQQQPEEQQQEQQQPEQQQPEQQQPEQQQPEQQQPEQQQPEQQQQEQQSGEQVTLKKLKSVRLKAISKKKIQVSWKKLSSKDLKKIRKIEIQVSTDPEFQTILKTRLISSKKTSYTVSGLKKNTKYYIRVRAYTEKDGVKNVSEWVKKSKKTKKK